MYTSSWAAGSIWLPGFSKLLARLLTLGSCTPAHHASSGGHSNSSAVTATAVDVGMAGPLAVSKLKNQPIHNCHNYRRVEMQICPKNSTPGKYHMLRQGASC